jgi:hypothetical protein
MLRILFPLSPTLNYYKEISDFFEILDRSYCNFHKFYFYIEFYFCYFLIIILFEKRDLLVEF